MHTRKIHLFYVHISYRDDKNQLATQNEELKQRLKQLQNECENISENRLKILSNFGVILHLY